jgi:hypothetical protein
MVIFDLYSRSSLVANPLLVLALCICDPFDQRTEANPPANLGLSEGPRDSVQLAPA